MEKAKTTGGVPEFEVNGRALGLICERLYGGDLRTMAEACGVNYETLRNWFKGRRQPHAGHLMKVSYAAGVPMQYLMKRREEC